MAAPPTAFPRRPVSSANLDVAEYDGYVDFVNDCRMQGVEAVTKPETGVRPRGPRIGRAGDLLLSNKILTLATLLRRSASVVYSRELGLSQSEWRIVAIVGDEAPLSLGRLVEILGLDKGQLSRGVTSLVDRGILARLPGKGDNREIRIDLTRHGGEIFACLMALALARNRELVADLNRAEQAALFNALNQLVENAKAILARSQASMG